MQQLSLFTPQLEVRIEGTIHQALEILTLAPMYWRYVEVYKPDHTFELIIEGSPDKIHWFKTNMNNLYKIKINHANQS